MKRFLELINEIKSQKDYDDFFLKFEDWPNMSWKKDFEAYDRALAVLDIDSWKILKEKAIEHYKGYRKGQDKEQFFNTLNEAFAYRYLVNRKGIKRVRFVEEEQKKRTPDISFLANNKQLYCEVKTLGLSNDEIELRETQSCGDGLNYYYLSDGFLNKLKKDIEIAWEQIYSLGENGLVYIIVRFDAFTFEHYNNYRKQLIGFSKEQGFDNLYIKMYYRGNKRISIISGW